MKRHKYLRNRRFSETLLEYGEQRNAEHKPTVLYERKLSADAKTKLQERREEMKDIMSVENAQTSRLKKFIYDPYTVGFVMIIFSAALIGSLSYGTMKAKTLPFENPRTITFKSPFTTK